MLILVAILTDLPLTRGHVVDQPYNAIAVLCENIERFTEELWCIDGGFAAFYRHYPFLCGPASFTISDLHPMPHDLSTDHNVIFLGSRVVPLDKKLLSDLRISHVIVQEAFADAKLTEGTTAFASLVIQ